MWLACRSERRTPLSAWSRNWRGSAWALTVHQPSRGDSMLVADVYWPCWNRVSQRQHKLYCWCVILKTWKMYAWSLHQTFLHHFLMSHRTYTYVMKRSTRSTTKQRNYINVFLCDHCEGKMRRVVLKVISIPVGQVFPRSRQQFVYIKFFSWLTKLAMVQSPDREQPFT